MDGVVISGLLPSDHYVTVSGLTHSTRYTFKITAIDNHGNESGFSNEITTRTVDIIKPGSPQNVHITATSDSTISLVWDPASDNVGVVIYHVYINGNLADSTSDTNITLTGLEAGARYSINISALDADRNKSRNSPPLTIQSLSFEKYYEDLEITIYPVPASHEIYITGKTILNSVELFDITGRKLLECRAEKSNQIHIDISMFPDGLYMVRINMGDRIQLNKIKIVH